MRCRGPTGTNGNCARGQIGDQELADVDEGGIGTWDWRLIDQKMNVEILKLRM